MKNSLIFLVILSLFSNCQHHKESLDYALLKSGNTELKTVDINLNLRNEDLSKSIERQLKISLCDENNFFSGKIIVEKIELDIPVYYNRYCSNNNQTAFHNIIPISINNQNNVLIGESIIEEHQSIKNRIIELTREMMLGREGRNTVIYGLFYEEDVELKILEGRIKEILDALLYYLNELSLKKYNKETYKLNPEELLSLKKEFSGILGLFDRSSRPPAPPPPPSLR